MFLKTPLPTTPYVPAHAVRRAALRDAIQLGLMQFASWSICTLSWRAVAQAHVGAAVLTDAMLGTLQFFVLRRIARAEANALVPWLGYTAGGVAGTVAGIYASLWWFGQ
jgi:hypothetical protein